MNKDRAAWTQASNTAGYVLIGVTCLTFAIVLALGGF